MMMQAHRWNNNSNIGYSDQIWHKMWKKNAAYHFENKLFATTKSTK
jgi:hypothetical protein